MNLFFILFLGLAAITQTAHGYATCKGAMRLFLNEQQEKNTVGFLTQWEVYRQCEVLPIERNRVATFHSEVQCKCPNKNEQDIYAPDKPRDLFCKSEIAEAKAARIDFSATRLPQELENLYNCIHKEKTLEALRKARTENKYYL
ncbi:hypothetical protein TcasGA2_TC033828 [Tribolium castaneum]|uniref:Uncharacterized protein n=1 Tax=Tribolium castaneum TaxID=7070 RepID=A0A139WEH7_TRICA|nr:hypothetical protein TcasGA2_TC033828 [Tribolium castaneum]